MSDAAARELEEAGKGLVSWENRRSLAEITARLLATADSVCGVFVPVSPNMRDLADRLAALVTYADTRAFLRHVVGLVTATLDEFDANSEG